MRGGQYCRQRTRIADYTQLDEKGWPKVFKFDSIHKAKRASRMLQLKQEGGLGRGSLYITT